MKALAKLVTLNDPNLVLFVGEALVGNDGIDQLQMFNQVEVCSHVGQALFAKRIWGLSGVGGQFQCGGPEKNRWHRSHQI